MGNFSCGCSNTGKEEFILATSPTFPEYDRPRSSSRDFINCMQNPCKPSDLKQTESTDRASIDIQGELYRLQKSSNESLVPRWCVLTLSTFKYYKNLFSAQCKDGPLFEIQVSKIICGRTYEKNEKLCIEISFFKESATVAAWKEGRRPLSEVFNVKDLRNLSLESFRTIKSQECENRIEVVVFVAKDREEWTRWANGLMGCIKSYLN